MQRSAQVRLALDASGGAIIGGRSEQQDAFRLRRLSDRNAWLIVLADGMGGHAAGALASKIAVDGFISTFTTLLAGNASLDAALQGALNDANERIARAQRNAPETAGMGSTLVGAYVTPRGISWVSVGDSPLWLYRNGELYRLNEDHSLREMVGVGGRGGNMLQSVLNGTPIPLTDLESNPEPLEGGDVILVASDGILTLPESHIMAVLHAGVSVHPADVVERLLADVESRGKSNQDNCTVVVATAWRAVPEQPPAPPPRSNRLADLIAGGIGGVAGAVMVFVGYFIWSLF